MSRTVHSHLAALHAEIAACTLCNEAGYYAETSPIVVNQPEVLTRVRRGCDAPRMMLVGQAPATPLRSKGKPFSGQAGRVLFSWLARAGFSEDEFRARCYFTAITKCYPGPASPSTPRRVQVDAAFEPALSLPKGAGGGKGDRVPTATERALCLPYLLRELNLIRPKLILTVGRVSTAYFLGSTIDFTQAVGQSFERDGRTMLPLPHPSGVSRWTNLPANQARLEQALALLKRMTNARVDPQTIENRR